VIARRVWPLVLVTAPAYTDARILEVIHEAALALPAGTLAVQLRDKARDRASLATFGWLLREATRAWGVALIVNGDARLAREVGADGVHLGGEGGTIAEALRARRRRLGHRSAVP
jgi:thiamine-phosphate pyrophosphorylase